MNILFWHLDETGWKRDITYAGLAAARLVCSLLELSDAFKAWSDAGMPPQFFYPLKAPWGIGIYHSTLNEDGVGVVCRARTWGKTHRFLDNRLCFTLELNVP